MHSTDVRAAKVALLAAVAFGNGFLAFALLIQQRWLNGLTALGLCLAVCVAVWITFRDQG